MQSKGFTAIELMIVCVVIALLAAIAIPSYRSYQDRAREAQVKGNMHYFQLAAEDFRVQSDSSYAWEAKFVAPLLAKDFRNPFDHSQGEDLAWEDRWSFFRPPHATPGIVSYADSADGSDYNIKGFGRYEPLSLVLRGMMADYTGAPKDEVGEVRRGGGTPRPAGPGGEGASGDGAVAPPSDANLESPAGLTPELF